MPSDCSCPIKPRERVEGGGGGWGMFLGIPRETGSTKGLTSFISFPLHPSAISLQAQQGWFTFPRPHSRLGGFLFCIVLFCFPEKVELLQETLISEAILILYKFTFKCGKEELSMKGPLKRGFLRIKKKKKN